MHVLRPTATGSTGSSRSIAWARHRVPTVAHRTFAHRPGSNPADDARTRAFPGGQLAATEVTDGLCLVVAGIVFHRGIRGSAGHGADVHGGFSPLPIANNATFPSRIVGRVLTHQVPLADGGTADCSGLRNFAKRVPRIRTLFFGDGVTNCQQQRRSSGNSAWIG